MANRGTNEMKCVNCNSTMKVQEGDHRYAENDGLNVLLKDIKITSCPGCGEGGVAIPKVNQLNEALAKAFARKSQRLEPAEIKFLRKYFGWSGQEFASRMGVTPETVSRWEHGARPMGSTAEILLRFSAIELSPVDEYPVPEFSELKMTKPLRLQLGKEWSVVV